MKKFLVTTALEETWREDVPILFLGEWCRRYSRKSHWERLNAEVLPYHWNERSTLYADYQNLQHFYEELLIELAVKLNLIHGVDHNVRYWRILIGPWLCVFLHAMFDRWSSIKQAMALGCISETIILDTKKGMFIPNDMTCFFHYIAGDEWNHHIFSEILQQQSGIQCIKQVPASLKTTLPSPPITRHYWKWKLHAMYSYFSQLLARETDAFLLTTYLPFLDELKLQQRLGQMPQLWRSVFASQSVAVDLTQRQWGLEEKKTSVFEALVRSMLVLHLPVAYLEGYHQQLAQVEKLPWPKRPKFIWTSNAHISDELFKVWAAKKVEDGTPLVIGQHGGIYGQAKWFFYEDHEIAISDRYLSWGWYDSHRPNIHPVGQLKVKSPLGCNHSIQKGALLVTMLNPRYSGCMHSITSTQYIDYLEDQYAFVGALPEYIQSYLTVRLAPTDYDWDQVDRWCDRFPKLKLADGKISMDELIQSSRIYIATYNATTYLEAFTMDIPTVIYWNSKYTELRDSAIPYFEDLKRVGIFHETPQSAAHQVARVWDNIDAWWQGKAVRDVLTRFKLQYCHLPDNILNEIERALQMVMR